MQYLWSPEPKPAELQAVCGLSPSMLQNISIYLRLQSYCSPKSMQNWDDIDYVVNLAGNWTSKALQAGSFFSTHSDVYLYLGQVGSNVISRNGVHPIAAISERLVKLGVTAIPVTEVGQNESFDTGFRHAVEITGGRGAIVINPALLRTPNWRSQFLQKTRMTDLATEDMDLIINWGKISARIVRYESASEDLFRILDAGPWRQTFSLQGACPESMTSFPDGTTTIPRNDWLFGRSLMDLALDQGIEIGFGDFGTRGDLPIDQNSFGRRGRPKYISTLEDRYLISKGRKIDPDNAANDFRKFANKLVSLEGWEGGEYCPGNRLLNQVSEGRERIAGNRKLVYAQESRHLHRVLDGLNRLSA